MKNVLLKIREVQNSLSTAEKYIAEYILSNTDEAKDLTIRELAEVTFTSPSSIIRFCRSLGFKGFKDFRQAFLIELSTMNQDSFGTSLTIDKEDSLKTISSKVTYTNIKSLEETLLLLDSNVLEEIVELLLSSKKILLFGIGSSQIVAQDFSLKMLRLSKDCYLNMDVHSQLLLAENSTSEDVAIIYSYSGETKEMLDYLDACLNNNTPVIAITRYSQSKLSKKSTYQLYTSASEPLFRYGAMSSRLSQLTINDILYSGMITKNYNKLMEQLIASHINKWNKIMEKR